MPILFRECSCLQAAFDALEAIDTLAEAKKDSLCLPEYSSTSRTRPIPLTFRIVVLGHTYFLAAAQCGLPACHPN
jgi:hypothetical protein